MIFTTYGMILLSVTVMFFILLVIEQLSTQNRLSRIYSVLTLIAFLYSLIESIVYLSSTKTIQFSFAAFGIFLITVLFTTWFTFICYYKKYNSLTNLKVFTLLSIIPFIYLIAAISDPITHILLNPSGEITGSAFTLFTHHAYIYSLILCIISAALVLKRRNKKLNIILPLLLGIAPIAIIFINLISNIILDIETMPILLLLFISGGVYGLYRSKEIQIVPISHDFFIDHINVGVVFDDENNIIREANPKVLEIFSEDESCIGKNIHEVFQNYNTSEEVKKLIDEKMQFYDKKHDKYYEIKIKEVYNNNNAKIGRIITYYDITNIIHAQEKSKIAEEKAQQKSAELDIANQEIDVLLKEVHHRVKNNLSMVLSFINLDKRYNNDAESILDNVLSRISAMALIYEETYIGEKYAEINVGGFIEESVNSIVKLYSKEINLKFDLNPNIESNMELITPINLILNELITNSLKYAFTDYEVDEKIISISLEKVSEDRASLIIQDNGKGLPENFDITKSESLGLTIVRSLTDQIRGELTQLNCDGTGYKIEFPL